MLKLTSPLKPPNSNSMIKSFLKPQKLKYIQHYTSRAMAIQGSKVEIADKDGHFRRKASQFRNFVSPDPTAEFPAEKGRYVLYINLGCPW
jgi:hypothetical protein